MKELIGRVETLLDDADPAAVELARALLDLYGEGLSRVVAAVGDTVAAELAGDELVAALLLLHGLHPLDTRTRVEAAVPAGQADVVTVEDGLVLLRLRPSGCRSSAVAAQAALESAVRDAAPEIERVEFEEAGPPPVVIPVESLTVRAGRT
ncbi:hypothetical protein ABT294_09805 [Nonomuraea sp. NPDC000554]|uniref:hypothetical protein n=1 Tax=Nonomuraea sp. NPDC000554 TaxID=3154259 RepID=UPI003332C6F4